MPVEGFRFNLACVLCFGTFEHVTPRISQVPLCLELILTFAQHFLYRDAVMISFGTSHSSSVAVSLIQHNNTFVCLLIGKCQEIVRHHRFIFDHTQAKVHSLCRLRPAHRCVARAHRVRLGIVHAPRLSLSSLDVSHKVSPTIPI